LKIIELQLVAFIMILALIPEIHGESISVGCGDSITVSGSNSASGGLVSDGIVTQSSASSTGIIDALNIDPWVRNTKGDYAEIGVTGTNVAGFTYTDNYYPIKNNVGVSDAVWAQQWLGASSADSLHAYARASNSAGDNAGADLSLSYGSLKGYYNAAYAGPANWLEMDRVASVQQTLDSANGNEILAQTWAVDSIGDAAGVSTDVKYGSLNSYSVLADAARYSDGLIAAGVSIDSMSASTNGLVSQEIATWDNKGDRSWAGTSINSGYLSTNSLAYSISDWGVAESNQYINAKAAVIDVAAYAQNSKQGYEYLIDTSGNKRDVAAPISSGLFEILTSNSLTASTNSKATTKNLLISPTLPTGTKTAIMLEPMSYAFTSIGSTDLRSTIFPVLVEKGYAVLSYDDAGASSDKFQDLGQYNVVLVDSHMNSNAIGLSSPDTKTKLDYLPASRIDYQTSKNSLVILAGCESFEGYPQKSALASAVNSAGLSGGYANSINIYWNHDYLSYFFDALGKGNTALYANTYANALATNKYGSNQYFMPLVFYGDQSFKL